MLPNVCARYKKNKGKAELQTCCTTLTRLNNASCVIFYLEAIALSFYGRNIIWETIQTWKYLILSNAFTGLIYLTAREHNSSNMND